MIRDQEACIREQARCAAEYHNPDQPDTRGAWAGVEDWLMEECLIELEARHD